MHELELVGIGNAIVDVIARVDEQFLTDRAYAKSSMTLVDEHDAVALLGQMNAPTMVSGGSAANTVFGAAHLGCRTAFIGRVRDDELGDHYRRDLQSAGVKFTVAASSAGPETGRCLIMVTPDGERTMRTYLGACQLLSEDDVDDGLIAASRLVYLEGYLWDPAPAKAAFLKASAIAHRHGREVALSLSDAFCVDRYREEFLQLMRDGSVDRLFANEAELLSLYREGDFDIALGQLKRESVQAVITRSDKGCVVVDGDNAFAVPAQPGITVVDSTGAGDLFAAGFLTGIARDLPSADCARLGAIAAAEIVQHIGARPVADVRAVAARHSIVV